MRIFSTLAESPQVGINVKPADDHTHYQITAFDSVVVARISDESLMQMLAIGHAVMTPAMAWSKFGALGNRNGTTGGLTVHRADFQLRGDFIRLVPENRQTLDVLHFMKNQHESDDMKCTNAALVTSLKIRWMAQTVHVARLSPGGFIGLAEPTGQVRSHSNQDHQPHRNYDRIITRLSEDGTTIDC